MSNFRTDGAPRALLDDAALAIHKFLKRKNYKHAFVGGYQLFLYTNGERSTFDVDVSIRPPKTLFKSWSFESLVDQLEKSSEFTIERAAPAQQNAPSHGIITVKHLDNDTPIDIVVW
jgi:hypothetical protein